MKNKTCGECRFFSIARNICIRKGVGGCLADSISCENFEELPKPPITNGEKLWDSGYEAVITFCKTWMDKFSCWADAEAWLTAPAENKAKDG